MLNRYDVLNVQNFNEGKNAPYLCCMCGQYTTLDNSISSRGYNLVCNHCVFKINDLTGEHDAMIKIQRVGEMKRKEVINE